MQKKILLGLGVIFLITAIIFQFNGCSIIGFTIGAIKDAKKPNETAIPGWEIKIIQPGTSIQIILKDGTQIQGKFSGFEQISDEEYEDYAESYTKSLERIDKDINLPSINDSIIVTILKTGTQYRGEFIGLNHQFIWIRMTGRTKPIMLYLDNISNIESRSKSLSVETVRTQIIENRIPLMSAVVIDNKAGSTQVAMHNIAQIIVPTKKHGKWIGLCIGAAADVVALIVVGAILGDMEGMGGIGGSIL